MVRSPQGSQLNSMESIWDYMKRQKQLRQSKSTEPWQVPQDALNNLPAKYLENVQKSVQTRAGTELKLTDIYWHSFLKESLLCDILHSVVYSIFIYCEILFWTKTIWSLALNLPTSYTHMHNHMHRQWQKKERKEKKITAMPYCPH